MKGRDPFVLQLIRTFSGILLLALISGVVLEVPFECRAQVSNNVHGSRPIRILMIFGESKDVPGNIVLEQAIRAELQRDVTNQIEFSSEYLDASRFSDRQHFRLFQEYLGRKYAGQKPDLIIAFPSRDYRLAGELPDALFPDVPVVFVAINEMEIPDAISKLGVTGIVQRFDLRGTLGLIMRLQPETRRIVVVGGVSDPDRATLDRIAEASHALEGVEFDFWTNRPVAELPRLTRSLPEGTVILVATAMRDVSGRAYYMSQLAQMLAPSASVPVYVLGGWVIGSGALGGSVVDSEELGTRTANLALHVLDGADPEKIPIKEATRGIPSVDWRALKRWDIKEGRLPPNCQVRYRPHSLWEQHQTLIIFVGVVVLAQAVTIAALLLQRRQRRWAEAEIQRQRTELAHVARVSTMGQLASALTHELNQPLGAILRNAEAAEIFLQSDQPDLREIRAILADIRRDDRRAGDVIDRMRTLFKRRRMASSRLDIRHLVEDTIALARPDARARQIQLIAQISPHLRGVQGDRVHLQQVLLNLILNGMDAMDSTPKWDRRLTVKVSETKNDSVLVAISDCGTGIAARVQAQIFEPFFTTKPDGMGMGLAISRTIIQAHGGEIWASNNPLGGATITFSLPCVKGENPGGLPAAS